MEAAHWLTGLVSGIVASTIALFVQHRFTKKQLSHGVQFEAEHKIYRELWAAISGLERRALQLRRIDEDVDPNESEEVRRSRKITEFAKACNGATYAIYDNRPFYANTVFDACNKLSDIVLDEWRGYQLHQPGVESLEGWEKATEAAGRIKGQAIVICEAIRKRIREMKVRT